MPEMISFEQEIKGFFRKKEIRFADNSGSFAMLDFTFGDLEIKRQFHFDVKEKRQHYNMRNWPDAIVPEEYLFVLDDLAARKVLVHAPNSGVIIRDNVHQRYVLFTVVDLYLMPKKRVNRLIERSVETYKGKWLVDLRNGQRFDDLAGVFAGIDSYLDNREDIFLRILECFGDYVGEEIGKGGIVRKPEHWEVDVNQTR